VTNNFSSNSSDASQAFSLAAIMEAFAHTYVHVPYACMKSVPSNPNNGSPLPAYGFRLSQGSRKQIHLPLRGTCVCVCVCIPRSALPALPDSACELRSSGGLMFPSYLSSRSVELAFHRRTNFMNEGGGFHGRRATSGNDTVFGQAGDKYNRSFQSFIHILPYCVCLSACL
jgi:hypothetical protein